MPRLPLLFFCYFLFVSGASAQDIRLGVFGLFHPRELTLTANRGEAVLLKAGSKSFVLDPHSRDTARIRLVGDALLLRFAKVSVQAREIQAASRNSERVRFTLSVPGKIHRGFTGTLSLRASNGEIVPVVNTDLEIAVATAVQAESPPAASLESLKAQAIVTRSYYVAGRGRHRNFDFCDLTHCQLFRDPPAPESPAVAAAKATEGLILTYEGKPIAAMFTRSCGGHTGTPAETGLPINAYPYFSVLCDRCYHTPETWTRRLSAADAELAAKGEAGRLAVNRRLGWKTVPSNHFTARQDGSEVVLEGAGSGHGMGLCQRGAEGMAEAGASFREILAHYFPKTEISPSKSTTNE